LNLLSHLRIDRTQLRNPDAARVLHHPSELLKIETNLSDSVTVVLNDSERSIASGARFQRQRTFDFRTDRTNATVRAFDSRAGSNDEIGV
jgi:hypothetical protein